MPTSVPLDHPHITRRPDVCAGEPIIDELPVTVRHVAVLYMAGENVAEISESLKLTEAQVFHGLSYYFDHRVEIDALIAGERADPKCEQTAAQIDNWWRYLQAARAEVEAAGGPLRAASEIEADRAEFRNEH